MSGLHSIARHWPWLVVAAAVAMQCAVASAPTAIARGFMGGVIGIAAMLATEGMPRARAAVAAAIVIGSVGLASGAGSFADPPLALWTEILHDDAMRIHHEIALPRTDHRWRAGADAGASPYLYVCARGRLDVPDTLDVSLGGDSLASLGPSMMFGPRPQPDSVGFYRIPLPWARLDGRDRISVGVTRHAGTSRPLEVCGTFMAKPTFRIDSSELFDGAGWTSPWVTRQGRYQIELRLVSDDGHVFGAWY